VARAFVFPGQGSQAVGMGKELANAFASAREVFEAVDDALGQGLSRLMFEGPEAELILTENAQPALMAVSLAAMGTLEKEGGIILSQIAACVAGHSLGEYSALAAAGALELGVTARLLKTRGEAMQKAVPVGEGAMVALLGIDLDTATKIAEEAARQTGSVCAAANDNAPGQAVVSGNKDAIECAIALATELGAKKSIHIPVSAPFHCPLMQPAADRMREALAEVSISPPVVPLIANVTAKAVSDPETIRGLLIDQVTGMVRWRESVLGMQALGVTDLIEVGAGKVLSGLARRIDRELATQAIGTPADVEAFLADIN